MTGSRGPRLLAIAATAVMAAAAIAGLVVLGPPSHQRSLRLDHRRVTDMGMIRMRVEVYWQQHHMLPVTLDVPEMANGNRRDPVTGQPYEYAVTGQRSYRLCARFDLPSDKTDQPLPVTFSDHAGGRQCVDQTITASEK